jgi:hypothetical protein
MLKTIEHMTCLLIVVHMHGKDIDNNAIIEMANKVKDLY